MTRAAGSVHSRSCVELLGLVRHVQDALSRRKVMYCKRQEVQTTSRTNKCHWRYVRDDKGRGGRDPKRLRARNDGQQTRTPSAA